MTLQTFYRRLRKEDPARWRITASGAVRRGDGCCPMGAQPECFPSAAPRPHIAADALRITPREAREIAAAADGKPRYNPRTRAALLRNLGLTEREA
jgi:hypothetical protein